MNGIAALEPPLFVDLDGTLVCTDLLWESLASALKLSPTEAVRGVLGLAKGRAALKRLLARASLVDTAHLPYRHDFVSWLRSEAQRGRRVYLATSADSHLAEAVAAELGFFRDVIASDGRNNRKGRAKLDAIRKLVGQEEFDYCGNGRDDLPLFSAARQSVVVGASPEVLRNAQAMGNVQRVFPDPPRSLEPWLRMMRPLQWLKNLLLFVPLLITFRISEGPALAACLLGFASFSLAASAGYLINDVLDIQSDRRHPRKRDRPLAAGNASIPGALLLAGILFVAAVAIGYGISRHFLVWLLLYELLTLSYSLFAKRLAMLDVAALAALYVVRILAGSVAIWVDVSFWMLSLSIFLFLSLALVKRSGELIAARDRQEQTVEGRPYEIVDLETLRPMGIACSVAVILLFALYVNSSEARSAYGAPQWLWMTLSAWMLWLGRVWLLTGRGLMKDDPLVYAISDRVSQVLLALMVAGFFLAALLGR